MNPTKITVLVKNNTVHFIHEEPPSPNVPCGFLMFILVLGLSLNACVFLFLVFASPKTTNFNLLLACFSFVLALEDVMNVTSSIVVRSSWEELYHVHGEASVRFLCALNATCLQFVAVFQLCVLAVISYERWTSLKETGGVKLKMVVPLVVVVSVVAALPIGLLATRHIEQRYSCSPVYVSPQPTQIVTASLTILIGYCIPPSIIFNSWLTITKEIQKERRSIHNLELLSRRTSPPVTFLHPEDTETRTKIPPYTLAALLIIFYFILVAPNIILVQATQFYSSYHIKKEQHLLFGTYRNNKTELPEELKPIETNPFDVVCIWARYSYTVVSPLLIILINEEVQKQCRKRCTAFREDIQLQKNRNHDRTQITTADWTTPVLFATAEGLHLRKTEVPGTATKEAFLPSTFSVEFCDLCVEKQREVRNLPARSLVRENSLEEMRKAGPSRQSQRRVPSGVEKNQNKFLEAKNEPLDKSSSSLLLTLHQRMRMRDY